MVRGLQNRFSNYEIRQMEKLLQEGKDEVLGENFLHKLTEEFNHASNRSGTRAIKMKQVQRWFRRRKNPASDATSSPSSSEELVNATDASLSDNTPECSSEMLKDTEKVPELLELEFEARSSKEGAWCNRCITGSYLWEYALTGIHASVDEYDVATFLAHRVLYSGEPEVRVRFQGFGAEEDEWVNVKKAVRERSIPLESSECKRVEVGDLVLCYRERSDHAMYYDAHVLEIQRKQHDIRGCRCLFLIKYDHDQIEEKVELKRLCRRP